MNCLRCGRETGENQSFCPECVKTVSQPLEESPYLSTRILLPVRKAVPAKSASGKGKKPERKTEKQSNASGGVSRGRTVIAVVLALAFALLGAYLYGVNLELRQEVAALEEYSDLQRSRMERINRVMVLAETDGSRLYHTLDCPVADGERCALMELALALRQQFHPCPECH